MRLRGKIDGIDAQSTTVTTREGKIVKLAITLDTPYCCIQAMKMSEIKAGSCVDAAGKSGKDGAIEALEAVVFPEEESSTGEDHYPWDLLPESRMTNTTVVAVAESNSDQELSLVYKDGFKKGDGTEGRADCDDLWGHSR